jgi:TolB protein
VSDDRNFDRNARSWLELGPTDIPPRVIADALYAIETTPQERGLRAPWKDFRMNSLTRLATAAVIGALALGGGLLLLNGPLAQVGHPSPTPFPTVQGIEGTPWLVFQSVGRPDETPIDTGTGSPAWASQLWAVKADGSALHVLANGTVVVFGSSFDISPDGSTVVFEGDGLQLYQASIEGGAAASLSKECGGQPCTGYDPSYSPDGRSVAFTAVSTTGTGTNMIAIVDLASGTFGYIERTTTDELAGAEMSPTWSPDGTRIAIAWTSRTSSGFLRTKHIAVVRVDGSSMVELPDPDGATFPGRPDWSPDGSRILFTASPKEGFGLPYAPRAPWIYTSRPDGSDATAVCGTCLENDRYASWTPNGRRILFWSGRTWALMDADGGNRAPINEQALIFPGAEANLGSVALLQPTR